MILLMCFKMTVIVVILLFKETCLFLYLKRLLPGKYTPADLLVAIGKSSLVFLAWPLCAYNFEEVKIFAISFIRLHQ